MRSLASLETAWRVGADRFVRKPENALAVPCAFGGDRWHVECADVLDGLALLPDASVSCVVTSPPYWGLRDYGVAGQMGLEATPAEYVARLVAVFREVRRVLADDGTLWLNLGDSYAGSWGAQSRPNAGSQEASTLLGGSMLSARQIASHPNGTLTGSLKNTPGLKAKDLVGIPWRTAFALQDDGWYLRSDIVWSKPNPMPESVTDRPTKAHEYLFLLSKSATYYYDAEAIAEPAYVGDHFRNGTSDGEQRAPGQKWQVGFSRRRTEGYDGDDDIRGPGPEYPALIDGAPPLRTMPRSGNKERKSATERGCPNDGVAGNVPWEGMTRNKRTVWTVTTEPFPGAHFAVMPTALVKPCVLAGCRPGGTVLDPFTGSGTVGVVALEHGCRFHGIELNPEYAQMAANRIQRVAAQGQLGFSAHA